MNTMVQQDTVELLKECNAGIKMGVASIDQVVEQVTDKKLAAILSDAKSDHEKLGRETLDQLVRMGETGKEPNPMAKGMSWVKTGMKLMTEPTDAAAASLIVDGCDMGVKSLSRYLNQYEQADQGAKDIARRLIRLEEDLENSLKPYL